MDMKNINAKTLKIGAIGAIVFVAYNVLVFSVCGFVNHGASFWISYIFMILSFFVISISAGTVNNKGIEAKDWLLGYPILRHCIIYITVEFIFSVAFMALDYAKAPSWIAFSVQFALLAIHLVFVISSFLAKDIIVDVQDKVKNSTSFIKMLQVSADMLVEKATDPVLKNAFLELSEQVRYSDPVSNGNLADLENRISQTLIFADNCLYANDVDGAMNACKKAGLLLTERNKMVRALK